MICPMCEGRGYVRLPYIEDGMVRRTEVSCEPCQGTGFVKEVRYDRGVKVGHSHRDTVQRPYQER